MSPAPMLKTYNFSYLCSRNPEVCAARRSEECDAKTIQEVLAFTFSRRRQM